MHRITNNWNLKLVSLVLAIMLWSYVRGEVNPLETSTVDVPLRVRAPRGFAFAHGQTVPAKVSVLLSGPRQSLRNLKGGALPNPLAAPDSPPLVNSSRLRVSLDWTKVRAGEQDVPLRAESLEPDIQVLHTKPGELTLKMIPATRKTQS